MTDAIRYPYFDSSEKYYALMTEGLDEKVKNSLANALAHHMIPIFKDDKYWYITRADYIAKGRPWSGINLETGRWEYTVEAPSSV